MLDPGHGGIDTGAIGRTVLIGKNTSYWQLPKTYALILRNHGIDARLTRQGIPLFRCTIRVEIAHKHGADLFMSIHYDGFTNPKAAGARFALSNRGASSYGGEVSPSVKTARDEVAAKSH